MALSPQNAGSRDRSVALLVLPDPSGRNPTAETQALVQQVAGGLRARRYRVVLAGVESSGAVEDLSAAANSAGVDLVIGMRVLSKSEPCGAILTPDRVPMPPVPKEPVSQSDLGVYVRQIASFQRAEASRRAAQLAGAISSSARACSRKPTELEHYVLDSCLGPTVLLTISPKDEKTFAERLPAIVAEWLGKEGAA